MASEIVSGWMENNGGKNNRMQIHAREVIILPSIILPLLALIAFLATNLTVRLVDAQTHLS